MTDRQAKAASLKILRKRIKRIKVYRDPWRNDGTFLLGYKGHQFLETGIIVAAPYIPGP